MTLLSWKRSKIFIALAFTALAGLAGVLMTRIGTASRSHALVSQAVSPSPSALVVPPAPTRLRRASQTGANSASPSSTPSSSTTLPTIWYTVSGSHILKYGRSAFIPYGVQLGGISMAASNWATNNSSHIDANEILAAKSIWHSNTVSLQVASQNLFARTPYDPSYLSRVDQIVNQVTSADMNIILVLQYEATTNQKFPTEDSLTFWKFMSSHYANRSRIFFDVFNEPRMPNGGIDDDKAWTLWRDGGVSDGVAYVGMQKIVNAIRKNAQNNLIFVDGLAAGEDIKLLPSHMLSGSNIVYAIHPYLSATQHSGPAQWDGWFGNAAEMGKFPVVADEWGEYANGSDAECYPGADLTTPTLLTYLRQKNIGLIGYALFPGTLIRGWDFSNPTKFDSSPYSCPSTSFPNMDSDAPGAGQLLMNYFHQYAEPL